MIKRIFFEAIQYLGIINKVISYMNLDDLQEISSLDSENMFEMVYSWPELIEKTLDQSFDLPSRNQYTQIIICGMGGSAVSGDYVQTLFENSLAIPIIVKRNYHLPKSITENSLVIAISYSGNTEETISCLKMSRYPFLYLSLTQSSIHRNSSILFHPADPDASQLPSHLHFSAHKKFPPMQI